LASLLKEDEEAKPAHVQQEKEKSSVIMYYVDCFVLDVNVSCLIVTDQNRRKKTKKIN
jgi:hypothetical protein